MIKFLVVEDDPDFVEEIQQIIEETPHRISCCYASSRDSALKFIESDFYDQIILDLNIPAVDGSLDTSPRHGLSVFFHSRLKLPGAPILVLTGSSAEDFIPDLLREQQQVDVWGEGGGLWDSILCQED